MTIRAATFHGLTLRVLRLLEEKTAGSAGRIVFVTSARPREGKTFLSIALAHHMAELSNGTVLLVDANFERPALHEHYGGDAGPGFSDALAEGRWSEACGRDSAVPGLKVAPAGRTLKLGLLFHTQAVEAVVRQWRERFGLVVIDGGTIDGCGSVPQAADGVALVVDASRTRREVVQGAMAKANLEPGRYLGAILNRRIQYIPPFLYRRF